MGHGGGGGLRENGARWYGAARHGVDDVDGVGFIQSGGKFS